MTCNASKFRSTSHRSKLISSGALSSLYPCFEGIKLQRLVKNHIRRGDKVRVRRGALVRFKGKTLPYGGLAPVKAQLIYSEDRELVARNLALRPTSFGPHVGEVMLHLSGLEHFLLKCGISLPGFPSSLVNAPNPRFSTTLSEWLTKDQIRTLVLAGRIRYDRDEDGVLIYLVAPRTIAWAGTQGYWREASEEDCSLVA